MNIPDPYLIVIALIVFALACWAILAIDAAERTYWEDEHEQSWKDRS